MRARTAEVLKRVVPVLTLGSPMLTCGLCVGSVLPVRAKHVVLPWGQVRVRRQLTLPTHQRLHRELHVQPRMVSCCDVVEPGCFGTWFVCTAAQAEACCWPFLSRASTLHSLALTQRVMPPGPGRMAGRANLASQALTRRCRVHLSCSRAPFPARAPEWLD